MRTESRVIGVAGGALVLGSAVVALSTGGGDIVVVGALVTAAAAIIGIAGGALSTAKPGVAALLMALGVGVAGLVAPGVIPAIADTGLVFISYLTGGALLVIGAIAAVLARNRAAVGDVVNFSH